MKPGRNAQPVQVAALKNPLMIISIGLLVLLMLLAGVTLSDAQMSGDINDCPQAIVDPEPVEAVVEETDTGDNEQAETLTMEIPLRKGGTVDLKLHSKDVVIEKYNGENVLLIIKSSRLAGLNDSGGRGTGAMDIQITRNGNDIQIESVKGTGSNRLPVDVSFKIMVPSQDQFYSKNLTHGQVFYKLLSVMQRTLNRETLKWLM